MDLLFKEYASPFLLLDGMIASKQFSDFLDEFDKQVEERQLWEFYIHKLSPFDERTFDQFKRDLNVEPLEKVNISTEQLETIVGTSYQMMNNFKM